MTTPTMAVKVLRAPRVRRAERLVQPRAWGYWP